MTLRTDIASRVRTELNDTSGSPVWTTAQLNQWLADGLYRLALDIPPYKNLAITLVNGTRDYNLPVNGVSPKGVRSVEYPPGYKIPPGDTSDYTDLTVFNSTTTGQAYKQAWELVWTSPAQGVLRFRYAPTLVAGYATANVWYYGLYLIPPDDLTNLDLNLYDESLLVFYVCERALTWLAEQKNKRGTPGANPSGSYYKNLYAEFMMARKRERGIYFGMVNLNG